MSESRVEAVDVPARGAPLLDRADIEAELVRHLKTKRAHHLFAIHGTALRGSMTIAEHGAVEIVPVRSELELRALMPPLTAIDARVAFLVPWTGSVPLDLQGRFARGGSVLRIGKDARLQRMFGVGDIDDEVRRSPLAELLLRPQTTQPSFAIGEGRLTIDLFWTTWLSRSFDLQGGLALDSLLAWAATHERPSTEFAELDADRAVRDAAESHFTRRLGLAGPLPWRAWEFGRGRRLLMLAVVFEALRASGGGQLAHAGARTWARAELQREVGVPASIDVEAATAQLAGAVEGALRIVARTTSESTVRALVREAETRVEDPDVRALLGASKRLPAGWRARQDALGEHLLTCATERTPAALGQAVDALRALEGHVAYPDPENEPTVARAHMAARLAAWLVSRSERRYDGGLTPYADVEALGRWYAEEGGYVDWARREVGRKPDETALDRGISEVLSAADDIRTELDGRFAHALAAWHEAGAPAREVVPIHDAADRFVARFLDGGAERRVLVLLLDGMAWAQAVELLDALGQRAMPWGPLRWHSSKEGRVGEGARPVVIAALPTMTDVSRAAFFAGKPMAPGKAEPTSKDVERWAQNRHIARFFTGTARPELLLRAESHTASGHASEAALTLVGDVSKRVVAVVVNAIDDSLKANPASRVRWRESDVASLPDLLDRAREAERVVLLASDHGHVRCDRVKSVGASTGGARWRPLAQGEGVAPGETRYEVGGGAWGPKGAAAVALLSTDTARYGGGTSSGEHGGATLAEVVAPFLLIASEDLSDVTRDTGASIGPASPPSWWHLDVRSAPVELPAVEVRAPRPKARPVSERQLAIPALAPPAPPAPAGPAVAPGPSLSPKTVRFAAAFESSEVLAARTGADKTFRADAVRAVVFLYERNGTASAAAFASEMKQLERRLGGYVVKLAEVLNLDGYTVLRHDPATQQVVLDVGKLQMLFEVKP